MKCIKMPNGMTVLVTVLCNQPEAYASDLSDDRSRYLCDIYNLFSSVI